METDAGPTWKPTPEVANMLYETATRNIARAVDTILQDSTNQLLMQLPETAGGLKFEKGLLQMHPLIQAAAKYKDKTLSLADAAEAMERIRPQLSEAYRRLSGVSQSKPGPVNPDDIITLEMAIGDFVQGAKQLKRLEGVMPSKSSMDREPDMQLGNTRLWFT